MYTYSDELFSDFYKAARGVRPRNHVFYFSTPDEKQRIWDNIMNENEEERARTIEHNKRCIEAYESKITELMKAGAADRPTAIRWILSSIDHDMDPGYAAYILSLPYRSAQSIELAEVMEKYLKHLKK